MKLKNKDLISITDLTKDEILGILRKTTDFKSNKAHGKPLAGKTLAMIFEKPSTRTRVSFECAIYQLGGLPIVLNAGDIQISRGETIADTARVLSGYVDGIMYRSFSHASVVELAKYATVPVINALSDFEHPCQILADLQTIMEKKGLDGTVTAFVGDGDNNVTNSLILACAIMGMKINIGAPKEYQPQKKVLEMAKAVNSKAKIFITDDPKEAVRDADVVYTDTWVSMGAEKEAEKRRKVFNAYQLNKELLENCKNRDYIVLHDLPAHRGEEITDEVMDSEKSAIFAQAENRMHAQKAVLFYLLGGKNA